MSHLAAVILAAALATALIGCVLVGGQGHNYARLTNEAVISRHAVEKDMQLLGFLQCLYQCEQLKASYCAYKPVDDIFEGWCWSLRREYAKLSPKVSPNKKYNGVEVYYKFQQEEKPAVPACKAKKPKKKPKIKTTNQPTSQPTTPQQTTDQPTTPQQTTDKPSIPTTTTEPTTKQPSDVPTSTKKPTTATAITTEPTIQELGFWTEGQTCSNLAMAFNGNLGFTKQEAKSACADACNKEDDCVFADLYYSSSRQICRISSTCGDWIKGKNSAYSLYQKQAPAYKLMSKCEANGHLTESECKVKGVDFVRDQVEQGNSFFQSWSTAMFGEAFSSRGHPPGCWTNNQGDINYNLLLSSSKTDASKMYICKEAAATTPVPTATTTDATTTDAAPIATVEYKLLDRRCQRTYSSCYTYKGADCNGWEAITLDECKEKCTNNDMPENCEPTTKKCAFFQYNSDSEKCQLFDDTCQPDKVLGTSQFFKKEVAATTPVPTTATTATTTTTTTAADLFRLASNHSELCPTNQQVSKGECRSDAMLEFVKKLVTTDSWLKGNKVKFLGSRSVSSRNPGCSVYGGDADSQLHHNPNANGRSTTESFRSICKNGSGTDGSDEQHQLG